MSPFDNDALQLAFRRERRRKRRLLAYVLVLLCLVLTPVGMSLGTLAGLKDTQRLVLAPLIVGALLIAGLIVSKVIQLATSATVGAFLNPGGAARQAAPHSHA